MMKSSLFVNGRVRVTVTVLLFSVDEHQRVTIDGYIYYIQANPQFINAEQVSPP